MRGPIEIVRLRTSLPSDRAGRPGLTPADLEALLARLAPDREQAGMLYEDIRRSLVGLFAGRLGGDAESLADEAIDRVAHRLAEGKTIHMERPFGYIRSVARHVAQEMLRRRKRELRTLGLLSALHDPEPVPEVDPRLVCLQKCLGRLPADQRRLILRYYGEDERISSRQRLAHELGIKVNALRIRAHRARRNLEDCCTRCREVEPAACAATQAYGDCPDPRANHQPRGPARAGSPPVTLNGIHACRILPGPQPRRSGGWR